MLRLARPTPTDNARRALFGWLTDKPVEQWAPATEADLPEQVRALAAYRRAETAEEQVDILRSLRARWDLLADAARGPAVWQAIARQMGPQALRMNLNTLVRHGVFDGKRWRRSSPSTWPGGWPMRTTFAGRGSSRTSSWRRT